MGMMAGVRADRAPARKAVALSGGSSLQFNGQGLSQLDSDVGMVQRSASDIGESGFKGGGGEIPHRAAMEQSFGRDFGNVQAYTGNAAVQANKDLGSNAYAMGSQIAFKSANPSEALVAHELTHVVQQTEGPAGSGSSHGGVDTSGESQAEAVEAAVASGRAATSVLGTAGGGEGPALKADGSMSKGGPRLSPDAGAKKDAKSKGESKGDGSDEKKKAEESKKQEEEAKSKASENKSAGGGKGGESKGGEQKKGPATKRDPATKKHDPALDFGMGTTFSTEGLEKSYEWTFWDKSYSWPIGAGINFILKPSVKAAVKGKVNYAGEDKGDASAALEVAGSLGIGISGGAPNVAELYAVLEPGISGSGEFTKKKDGGSEVKLGAFVKVAGKIGVSLGGGIVDYAFQLFEAELLQIAGVSWKNGALASSGVFKAGKDIKPIVDAIAKIIEKAKAAGAAIYNGAVSAGNYVADKASAAYDWITSW